MATGRFFVVWRVRGAEAVHPRAEREREIVNERTWPAAGEEGRQCGEKEEGEEEENSRDGGRERSIERSRIAV